MNHPTPWRIVHHNSQLSAVWYHPIDIFDANDKRVLRVGVTIDALPIAERIVKAINSAQDSGCG